MNDVISQADKKDEVVVMGDFHGRLGERDYENSKYLESPLETLYQQEIKMAKICWI